MNMKFENTVTLGNVLTAISMTVAGAAAWTNMSERVSRIEQNQVSARETDMRHESDIREVKSENRSVLLEIKQDIKELRNDIKRVKP
jgi:hypothetical protein